MYLQTHLQRRAGGSPLIPEFSEAPPLLNRGRGSASAEQQQLRHTATTLTDQRADSGVGRVAPLSNNRALSPATEQHRHQHSQQPATYRSEQPDEEGRNSVNHQDLEDAFNETNTCIIFANYSEEYDSLLKLPAENPLIDPNDRRRRRMSSYKAWPQLVLGLSNAFITICLCNGHAFPKCKDLQNRTVESIILARREQLAIAHTSNSASLEGMFCAYKILNSWHY
jgi:hypothetical protein